MFNLEAYGALNREERHMLMQASTCQPLKQLIAQEIRLIENDILDMTTHENGEKFKYDYILLKAKRDYLQNFLNFLRDHTLSMQAEQK